MTDAQTLEQIAARVAEKDLEIAYLIKSAISEEKRLESYLIVMLDEINDFRLKEAIPELGTVWRVEAKKTPLPPNAKKPDLRGMTERKRTPNQI